MFELLKEPSKRKLPTQSSTVDHILLFRLHNIIAFCYVELIETKIFLFH